MTENNHNKNNKTDETTTSDAPTLKQTIASVGSAFIGIQSGKNRQRDFSQGKFSHFIIAGIIGVVIFISALVLIVNLVLPE